MAFRKSIWKRHHNFLLHFPSLKLSKVVSNNNSKGKRNMEGKTENKRPKRFIGRRNAKTEDSKEIVKKDAPKLSPFSIPDTILHNEELNSMISLLLPRSYNFEIHKTIHKISLENSKVVALQMPEGLLMYSCILSDIFQKFANVECIILGDVTYGACCVDDFTAVALGADFMVHYGHSCLVPITKTKIKILYVFVDIEIDVQHLVSTIKLNFPAEEQHTPNLSLVSTIQFAPSIQQAKILLQSQYPSLNIPQIFFPQAKPLSPGELLGCTSPILNQDCNAIIYVADGRFHLESIMIHNPDIPAYKYDPYSKMFSREYYDIDKMMINRKRHIDIASKATRVGVIMGTLGRQGAPNVAAHVISLLEARKIDYTIILLSEIFPAKLELFSGVEAFVQIACPRLSIDWGLSFKVPLLNPYEAEVAFGKETWVHKKYKMDFYSKQGGEWSVYYES